MTLTRLSGTLVLAFVLCLPTTTALAQTGSISGTVYDELTTAAVADLAVELQDAGGGTLATTATDGTGAYAFSGLAAGAYLVRVPSDPARDLVGEYYDGANEFDGDLATRLVLGDGEALTADFHLARGGSISGTVSGLGAGEEVGLQVLDAASGRYRGGTGSSAGAYTVDSLAAATYRLFANPGGTDRAFQWFDGKLHFGEADDIPVAADEDVSGKDLTLGPGRRIAGHVSLDGVADVEGAGVAADQVGGGFGWGAGTDALGDFTIANLPPGQYTVRVESGSVDEPFTAALWQDKTLYDDGDPVDVTAADAAGVDFVVHRERVISGQVFLDADDDQVQDAGEAGLGNVTVRVYDFATGRWLGHGAVAADGRWAVGVAPGVYRVEAGPHPPNLLWESWPDAYFPEDAQPVDVSAADATSIDFGIVDGAAYGTLRGRVVDGGTLAGIPGVDVQVWRFSDDRRVLSRPTDAAGFFTVTSLPPGSYKVLFETRDTNVAHGTDYVSSFWSTGGEARIDYPAVAGDGTDLGSFELAAGGSISGTVYPPGGDSLPLPFDVVVQYFAGSGPPLPGAAVQADGSYQLRGLPEGWFRVQTGLWGSAFVQVFYLTASASTFDGNSATPVAVTQGAEIAGIDLRLERGGSISGTVTRASDGAPLAGVPVGGYLVGDPQGRGYWNGTNTGADGTYLLTGLPSGDFRVRTDDRGGAYANQHTTVAVTAPSETAGVDFALTAAASLRGRVYEDANASGDYDAGEERAGVLIQALDFATGEWLGNAVAGSDGLYEIGGLGAGTYQVQLEPGDSEFVRMWWDNDFNQATPVEITAAGGVPQDVTGLDFRVVRGHEISGLIFFDADADGVRDPGEGGLSNAWVNAHSVDGTSHAWGGPRSGGTYSLRVLPGRYTVNAGAPGLIAETWQNVFFGSEATAVDATAGAAAGIDFSLVDGAAYGTLRGRVLAAGTLAPIPGVDVQVRRLDTGERFAGATTGADGRFVFTDLPPSPAAGYEVWFETSWTNTDNDSDHVASFWAASGEPGVIDPDDLRVVFPTLPDPPSGPGTDLGDFALKRGGSISGTVFPPGGETLPDGLWVSVQSFESGGQSLPGAQVEAGGGYRVRGLPAPATYRVQANAWGTGLVSVYYLTAAASTFDNNTAAAVGVVAGADTPDVDLHLFRGGSISGRVTRASDGTPVAAFPITTHLVNDTLGRNYWDNAQTGADGTYTLSGLPTGEYEVRTDARQGALANQTYPSFVPVAAPDDTPFIDFVLAPAARISGRVTQVVGGLTEPVVNMRVQAQDYAGGDLVSDGYTDAGGYYAIEALGQDRAYRVQVIPWEGPDPQFFNFVIEYYDDRLTWDAADPVVIAAGVTEVGDVDFELALGGAVSGFVRGATTAEPLQGVWVSADDYGGLGYGNGDQTDHNGFYVIRGLPAGTYRVHANPWPQPWVEEYFDDTLDWSQATPVTVAAVPAGGPIPVTEGIDFDLDGSFTVSGRVTEADGTTPIPGLDVRANGLDVPYGAGAVTGADGAYQIRGLPAGHFTVSAETAGTDWVRRQQDVDLTAGDVGGVDFALQVGAVLAGRVYLDVNGSGTYDAGEERPDVYLQADDYGTGWYVSDGISGADGRYEIRGLGAGSYRLSLQTDTHNFVRMYYDHVFQNGDATPVAVAEVGGAPQDVSGIDFRVVQGAEIRGLVFYDVNGDGLRQLPGDAALHRIGVGAENRDGISVDWAWGQTEPDGTYVIHGVYPGHYRVIANAGGTPYAGELFKLAGGLPVGTWRRSEADVVDVTGGDATAIDFSLGLGGGVTGTVRDHATGEPIANVDLWINAFDGDGLWSGATTDLAGGYLATGLPPGDYQVQAWDRQGVYVSELHLDAVFSDAATPAHVAARGSLSDPLATLVDFDLDQGGALAGVVYDDADGDGSRGAGEAGIGGVQVHVDEHAAPHRYLTNGTTAADGTYRVGGLPPGLGLRVRVQASPTDFIGVYYDGGDDRGTLDGEQAAAVTATAGGTQAGIDFGLAAGGAIAGTVTDGDGVPLAGMWVSAQPFDGTPGSGGHTDAAGRYTVHGLAPGDYRLWAGGGLYAQEYYDNLSEWRTATPVTVAAGVTTGGVDFILPVVPRIAGGPSPASGERGSTVTGVTVVGEQLAGTPRLEFGAGVTVQNLVLDAGTFTFDLAIAADAPLGARALSLVNDMAFEDGAAVRPSAFTVEKAASGDVPAPYSERFYTIDNGTSRLRVYAGSDQTFLGAIDVCANPSGLAVPGDGRFAYVSCGDRSVVVVDLRLGALGEEVARFQAVGAYNVKGLDATGAYLYALDRETGLNRVHVVDLATWEVTAQITVGVLPWALEVDPAGKTLWVVNRLGDSLSVIDVDPASPTLHTVLATVPLPGGTQGRGLAFTPDGSRVWVVGVRQTFVVDTAARTVLGSLSTPGSGRGTIAIAAHAAAGKDLAFLNVGQAIWVIDASPALPAPQVLRSFTAGLNPNGLAATPDRLYVSHGASLDLYALDTAEILTGAALSLSRFDRSEAVGVPPADAAVTPGGALAVAPVPAAPPANAPVVSAITGTPAANGAPFTVTVAGANFTPASLVALRGTHVRGNVLTFSATALQVEFPAVTPAGSHTVVVSSPVAGGNASGAGATPLEVVPPAGYQPTQTFYVTAYGTGRMHVFAPGGSRDVVLTEPYPAGVSITPDGRQAFVVQLHESAWSSWDVLPETSGDVSVVDLDPASPDYRRVAAAVPLVWSSFASPAVTPNLDNPNGVFVYAPNRYLSDTVSVIDPVARAEVDVDGNPDTQSIPPDDPYTEPYGQGLAGITRIELDGAVTDLSLAPIDGALTPDGALLYVANLAGRVSIVDTVTHQVVGELTAQGQLTRANALAVSPAAAGVPVLVSVVGLDGGGVPSIFVFEAGVLDDAAALMDQIVLPEPELPREVGITRDGRVYVTARLLGELWAVDLRPASWGKAAWGQIERVPLFPGIYEPAEAADDQLLYVANGFRNEVYVLDLAAARRHELVTTFAVPGSPGAIAVEPVLAGLKPEVGHVSPGHGSPAGGDAVLVTGVRFAPGATVDFGGAAAGGVVVESAFLIRAVTPAGAAGAVDVKVTNPDHRFDVLAGGFTYAADTAPPVFITLPYVAGRTTATAEIRWRTDEASTSLVEYRRTGDAVFLQASDPALVTDHRITLLSLTPATGYEYRVTSADASSNTASSPTAPGVETFTTLAAPDVTPPVIVSGPALVSVSTTSATLQWETDETATSVLQYDAQLDGQLDRQAFGPDATLHSVTLTGLAAGTRYEYKALSVDASGNGPTASALATFDTDSVPDATPPAITLGPGVLYLSNDLVAILWVTDEASTSFVNYGTASLAEASVVDVDPVLSHVVFLTNLLPNTAYRYQVGSQDAAGNTVLSADPFASLTLQPPGIFKLGHSLEAGRVTLPAGTALSRLKAADGFTTPAAPDTTPPQVLAHGVTPLSTDRALVTVEVDEAASLEARWGAGGLTSTAFAPTYSRAPSLLLAGLAADTTYQLELELTDPKGNAAVVSGLTFTTPAAPDVTPPALSAVTVAAVTDTTVQVTWQTDEPADATLRAGVRQIGRLGLATSHSLLLTGLEPSTAYAFEAASRDAVGNGGVATGTFTTLPVAPLISSVLPPRAAQGATVEVAVNGAHFGAGAQVGFGPGVTVGAVTVNAAGTQLRAAITVAPAAAVGERLVTVTTGGQTATAPFAIVDATVPVVTITEPEDGAELPSSTVVVRGTVSEPADVTVNGVAAVVTPGAPITFEATVTLPEAGPNRILATAVDASGNRGTAVVVLTVVATDTTPPVLELAASPAVLWPPNHKMVPVAIDVQVADDQDPSPQVALVAVTSNEPDDAPGGGDGNTVNDIQGADLGTDDRAVLLRAERGGSGAGRVYTLTYRATDQAGNAAEASVEVVVPLNQGKAERP